MKYIKNVFIVITMLALTLNIISCAKNQVVQKEKTQSQTQETKTKETFTVQVKVYDVISLKPIEEAKIIFSAIGRQKHHKKPYSKSITTDKKGTYKFKDIPKNLLYTNTRLVFNITKDGYAKTILNKAISPKSVKTALEKIEIGLVNPKEEIKFKGKIIDAVTNLPLKGLRLNIELSEYNQKERKMEVKKTILLETDEKGAYETTITAEYCPLPGVRYKYLRKKFLDQRYMLIKNHPDYRFTQFQKKYLSKLDDRVIEEDTYILDLNKKGSVSGKLLDTNGNALTGVPVTINLGTRKG